MSRTINEIINEKLSEARRADALRAVWEAVEIAKKADGGEFKRLTARCVTGAIVEGHESTSGTVYIIHVGVWPACGTGYTSDDITTKGKTPKEIREEIIPGRVEYWRKVAEDKTAQAEWLEANRARVLELTKAYRAELLKGAPGKYMSFDVADVVGDSIRFGINERDFIAGE